MARLRTSALCLIGASFLVAIPMATSATVSGTSPGDSTRPTRIMPAIEGQTSVPSTTRIEPASAGESDVAAGGLSAALAAARPGETLRLLAGIHPGPLTIDTTLRIVGEPGAVIEGNGSGSVLVLAADGIVLDGVTVRGSGADLSTDDAVILLYESHGITVRNCRVEARAFGIYLRAGDGHLIAGNEVRGDASLVIDQRGNGIHLWNTEKNEVRENTLVDVRDGVYLSFAHDNRIVGNAGTGQRYGIHYMYSERNLLRENRFSGCTGGIALMFSMRNTIESNETVDNQDFGILCQQLEGSVLRGNLTERNGRGFYVENSATNRFEENTIAANGVGVFLTAGSEQNLFTGNRFTGNLVQVFQNRTPQNTWWYEGRGNEWSDYVGFDWNADGVGETPYRLQTAASALMARRPAARWFWMSPVLALLDWWDSNTRESQSEAYLDPFPLVARPGAASVASPSTATHPPAGTLQ